ncbi:hypothetical protein [Variovorax paradoxus]|uniref:Uncharacterized protein n=1 Tax=Variovorax paradoxus TaxID=34073 RepID=A0A6I6HF62_VARPD|nr:hypothetical protein [Variovorax paradoxus]QGW82104.1 hypothetical protein GOQ09_11130 [Variovorax paradoxus]
MTTKRYHKQGDIGRRLMWTLLAVVAIVVVAVLFFYGLRDPSEGPGNVPASGAPAQQQDARPAAPK